MSENQPFSPEPPRPVLIGGILRKPRPRKPESHQIDVDDCGRLIQSYARGSLRVEKSVRYILSVKLCEDEESHAIIRQLLAKIPVPKPPEKVFRAGLAIVVHAAEKEKALQKKSGHNNAHQRLVGNCVHKVARRLEGLTSAPTPRELSDVRNRVAQIEGQLTIFVNWWKSIN